MFKISAVEKRDMCEVYIYYIDGYRKTQILTLQVSNSTSQAEVSNNVHDKQISVQWAASNIHRNRNKSNQYGACRLLFASERLVLYVRR